LKRYTTPEKPVFFYNPLTETDSDDFKLEQPQIMVMAIDFLPSLLPYDASKIYHNIRGLELGKYLNKIVPEIALSDSSKPISE